MSEEPPEQPGPPGTVRPTSYGTLVGAALVALVGGWLVHRIGLEPMVTWVQVLVLFFVAAVLGATAYLTWRQVQQRRAWLEPHRAVNRLVLAKACAPVGALVAGGYAGYALSWVGVVSELAGQWLLRSLLAALGGVLIVIASVLLERACRTHDDEPSN